MVTNETQEQLEARGWDFTDEFIPDPPIVNNQDKTVNVSENGTIEVTPDEGFTGLGKVTVNTNVEGVGDIKLIYLDLSLSGSVSVSAAKSRFSKMNALVKVNNSISSVSVLSNAVTAPVKAVALPLGMRTTVSSTSDITVTEAYLTTQLGLNWRNWQITEAEFYDLNA